MHTVRRVAGVRVVGHGEVEGARENTSQRIPRKGRGAARPAADGTAASSDRAVVGGIDSASGCRPIG